MTQEEPMGKVARHRMGAGVEGGAVGWVGSRVSQGFLGCGEEFGFVSECDGGHGI